AVAGVVGGRDPRRVARARPAQRAVVVGPRGRTHRRAHADRAHRPRDHGRGDTQQSGCDGLSDAHRSRGVAAGFRRGVRIVLPRRARAEADPATQPGTPGGMTAVDEVSRLTERYDLGLLDRRDLLHSPRNALLDAAEANDETVAAAVAVAILCPPIHPDDVVWLISTADDIRRRTWTAHESPETR